MYFTVKVLPPRLPGQLVDPASQPPVVTIAVKTTAEETFQDVWNSTEKKLQRDYGKKHTLTAYFDRFKDQSGAELALDDQVIDFFPETRPQSEWILLLQRNAIDRQDTVPVGSHLRPEGFSKRTLEDLDEDEREEYKRIKEQQDRFGAAVEELNPDKPVQSREPENGTPGTFAAPSSDAGPQQELRRDAQGFAVPAVPSALKSTRKFLQPQTRRATTHSGSAANVHVPDSQTPASNGKLRSSAGPTTPLNSSQEKPGRSQEVPTSAQRPRDDDTTFSYTQEDLDNELLANGPGDSEDEVAENGVVEDEIEDDLYNGTPPRRLAEARRPEDRQSTVRRPEEGKSKGKQRAKDPDAFERMKSSQSSQSRQSRKSREAGRGKDPQWTDEEDELLLKGLREGMKSIPAIITRFKLDRTPSGCRNRKKHLLKLHPDLKMLPKQPRGGSSSRASSNRPSSAPPQSSGTLPFSSALQPSSSQVSPSAQQQATVAAKRAKQKPDTGQRQSNGTNTQVARQLALELRGDTQQSGNPNTEVNDAAQAVLDQVEEVDDVEQVGAEQVGAGHFNDAQLGAGKTDDVDPQLAADIQHAADPHTSTESHQSMGVTEASEVTQQKAADSSVSSLPLVVDDAVRGLSPAVVIPTRKPVAQPAHTATPGPIKPSGKKSAAKSSQSATPGPSRSKGRKSAAAQIDPLVKFAPAPFDFNADVRTSASNDDGEQENYLFRSDAEIWASARKKSENPVMQRHAFEDLQFNNRHLVNQQEQNHAENARLRQRMKRIWYARAVAAGMPPWTKESPRSRGILAPQDELADEELGRGVDDERIQACNWDEDLTPQVFAAVYDWMFEPGGDYAGQRKKYDDWEPSQGPVDADEEAEDYDEEDEEEDDFVEIVDGGGQVVEAEEGEMPEQSFVGSRLGNGTLKQTTTLTQQVEEMDLTSAATSSRDSTNAPHLVGEDEDGDDFERLPPDTPIEERGEAATVFHSLPQTPVRATRLPNTNAASVKVVSPGRIATHVEVEVTPPHIRAEFAPPPDPTSITNTTLPTPDESSEAGTSTVTTTGLLPPAPLSETSRRSHLSSRERRNRTAKRAERDAQKVARRSSGGQEATPGVQMSGARRYTETVEEADRRRQRVHAAMLDAQLNGSASAHSPSPEVKAAIGMQQTRTSIVRPASQAAKPAEMRPPTTTRKGIVRETSQTAAPAAAGPPDATPRTKRRNQEVQQTSFLTSLWRGDGMPQRRQERKEVQVSKPAALPFGDDDDDEESEGE